MADQPPTKDQTTLASPGVVTTPALPELASTLDTHTSGKRTPLCSTCKGPLDVYAGGNPHKAGTGFCPTCGTRQPVK